MKSAGNFERSITNGSASSGVHVAPTRARRTSRGLARTRRGGGRPPRAALGVALGARGGEPVVRAGDTGDGRAQHARRGQAVVLVGGGEVVTGGQDITTLKVWR